MSRVRVARVATVSLVALLAVACAGDDSTRSEPPATVAEGAGEGMLEGPPANPFLADSVVPIGHFDSAQSDSVSVPGPTGPTGTLTEDEMTYTHLGPAHFGIAISPPYPDGRRTIWSNGGDRVSKLDADTLEVIDEFQLPGRTLMTETAADAALDEIDRTQGRPLADLAVTLAAEHLAGLAGVYYVLDRDNTLFVGSADSVVAYQDVEPGVVDSPIEVRDEWPKPAEVGGRFVGVNMTFDGRLALVTDEGWLVLVARDFSTYDAVQLQGAGAARAHNEAMAAAGRRPGQADWVRNSVAVDEDGGIYVASVDHMHKVVWDGRRLSTDPADGAWRAPYRNGSGAGTGATPSLMGFGDDDRFVVITDGEDLMNVVLFWRDEIPPGWEAPPGAPSDRIAGQVPADMGDPDLTAIQTEQSVVVGGYGALVVNNDPPTVPDGFPEAGVRVLAAYAGADPAFTPHGIQKFEWDPERQVFAEAWATREISSANAVPMVSTGSGLVYTVGARDGDWTVEAVDWETGSSTFHWVTGSSRFNTNFSGMNIDGDGRILHTTTFGIVRYEPDG